MIGPNVITLGGSWPECQTTSAKVLSSKRRRTADEECPETQDGGGMAAGKRRRNNKSTLFDTENKPQARGMPVSTKNISNNLIISHDSNSNETVLIIDANFGCTRTCNNSITTNTETFNNFSDSFPATEVVSLAATDVQTGSVPLETGNAPALMGSASAQTPQSEAGDNPNLSWLLDFKVSSLFDPDGCEETEDHVDGEYNGGESQLNTTSSVSSSTFTLPPPTPFPPQPTNNRLLKPPFTYTELIEQALREQGQLTVSGIYNWMSEKFPFFKAHDERWKNSVRHNLSINPHFRKGMKASQGSGHFWTLSTQGAPPPNNDTWKIAEVKSLIENQETEKSYMDEVATATASIEEPSSQPRFSTPPPPLMVIPDSAPDPSLARTAEEILSGVKKEVQVQYLSADTDFLNQMTRNGLVEETNLTEVSTSFLMNDLGSEVILNDSFFCDDLNFQYCELTTAQM